MSNPSLSVPLSDYEGHMRSPVVQQLEPLSDLFAEALALCRPASLAILGIAGGNGLGRIDAAATRRIVGVDINAQYLDAVRERYAATLPQLELFCVDLFQQRLQIPPVDLVHAALWNSEHKVALFWFTEDIGRTGLDRVPQLSC